MAMPHALHRRLALALALASLAGCLGTAPGPAGGAAPGPSQPQAPGMDDAAWASHAPQPLPRYELAVARVGGQVLTLAGLTQGLVMTQVAEWYDLAGDAWGLAPPYPHVAHHLTATAVGPGGEPDEGPLYAFGGWVGLGTSASSLAFRLDPGGAAWLPLLPMPRARGAHAAAALDGEVWLLGGTGADGSNLAAVDIYNAATGTWREGPPLPKPRDHLSAAVLDGRLYLAGGRERTLDTTSADLFVLAPDHASWVPLAPMAQVRGGFALAPWRGLLVAAGGEWAGDPRLLATAEAYDPARDVWGPIAEMSKGRTGIGGVAWEDRAWVFGGTPDAPPNGDAPESYGPVG